jgi:peptide/nickel transport system ATP-binding protein|tara:strand:- start:1052 stop:1918 length:867 start_codon:yes stop_codon:yes gene_type:complete
MSFLTINNLTAHVGKRPVLRDVSLSVQAGEVCGLVGESGAGKSMIGKAVLGILPLAIEATGGEIILAGVDLQSLPAKERRQFIGAKTALIPQDPLTALNPSRRVGSQITNRLVDILGWTKPDAEHRALELLSEVQIDDPKRVMLCYPHELSGGMRQRLLIAAAFAAEPQLIIADEPTTALDVTVQKQILRLIKEMQARYGTALLFVTHDLGVVSKVCQKVLVLYDGVVLEQATVEDFFTGPRHPYSRALLEATPKYTDPTGSLTPIPLHVLEGVRLQVAAYDRMQNHV